MRKLAMSKAQKTLAAEQQNFRCAICDTFPDKGRGKVLKLVPDHCHRWGAFRGMLCNNCNTGIGMFAENPEVMRRAAEYIERHANAPRIARPPRVQPKNDGGWAARKAKYGPSGRRQRSARG